MRITDILDKRCIRFPLAAEEKTAAIHELVDVLHEAGKITSRDAVLEAILSRERTRSTGIGRGLAVPHGKSTACPSLAMAIGRPRQPIDFGSIDGTPCELVVLLASPVDHTGPHIQALAGVSRLWLDDDFRQEIAKASTIDALYAAIERHQAT